MIALREFEKSVVYLERGSQRQHINIHFTWFTDSFIFSARHIANSSSSSLPIVREAKDHIEHCTDTLSTIISRDLSNTLLTKIQFQRYVNWLLRLDKSEKARQVFLGTRTLIIKKRIR